MPKTAGADALMTQAGVGLCAYKTTDQKAEAAALFVRWLTENRTKPGLRGPDRLYAGTERCL